MRYPTIDFNVSNFIGGLNTAIDESLLKSNETANQENIDIDNGTLKNSKGYKRFANIDLDNIKSLMTYYKNNEPVTIVGANRCLYELNGTSFRIIKGGFNSDIWDYVNYKLNGKDVIILTNGVDYIQCYDGEKIRDLKLNGKDSVDSNTNKAPKGRFLEVHYERLFVLSDEYLYISKDFDFDDFTTPVDEDGVETNQHGAYMELYSADGSKPIGMKVIFDSVVIFKERTMFKVFGASPSNYQVSTIFNSNGAIADKSIAITNKGAYFISKDGIYLYDGVNCELISEKVNAIFKDVKLSLLNNSCAFIDGHKYILALPKERNNDLIIEYNLLSNTYTKRTGISVNEFNKSGNDMLFVNDKGIFIFNSTSKYCNENINCFWETPYSNMGVPNAIKEVSDCYITCNGSGQIKVSCITEKKVKSKIVNLSSTDKVYRINLNSKGRLVKFRFENIDGSEFEVKSFSSLIELDED